MEKFIGNYFRLLNLRNMPEAVFANYEKYIQKDDFPNKDVKKWSGPEWLDQSTMKWKDLPDFATLSDDDLNLLYVDLLETLAEMDAHKDKLSDDAKKFVETYYGPGKPFLPQEIQPAEKQQIKDLISLLLNDPDIIDMDFLAGEYDAESTLQSVLDDRKKCEDKDVRRLIFRVISNVRQTKKQGYLSPEAENKLSALHFDDIQKAVKPLDVKDVSNTNRNALKNKSPEIFETLYKKNKIYDAFKKYEPGEKIISEQIDSALSDTDYTGKINEKNYVAPTYKDDLNLKQKIDKKLEDTYSDVLKKYLTLHRANLFMKPEAKEIFKAFDKAKIKPTDGLDKILEQSDTIIGNLKGKPPFEAADHLKWLVEKLNTFKKNGMGKAVSTALRNKHQMQHIVEQLIIEAADKDEVKKAKTALEVLSVMQYGMFTSRTMDAINQTDMTILSDGKLSWNKNEGIQFVTKAADKTLKAGIQLGGYAATATTNKIFRNAGPLSKSDKLNKKLKSEKEKFDDEKRKKDTDDLAMIDSEQTRKNNTNITDLDAEKNSLQNGRIYEANLKADIDSKQSILNGYNDINNDFNRRQQLETERANIQQEITRLEELLVHTPSVAPTQYGTMAIEAKKQELIQYKSELKEKDNQINGINAKYSGRGLTLNNEYTKIHTTTNGATMDPYTLVQNELQSAQTDYATQHSDNEDLENRIRIYEETTENIKNAENGIAARDKAEREWNDVDKNKYLELMAYWDFLQSGQTKSLFHIKTSNLQKKMDNGRMQTMLDSWNKSYAA